MTRTTAYVGIGSNLEAPSRQVQSAFDALAALPGTRLVARSSLYRSAPLGYAEQPDFVNAVARLDTALDAEALLAALHEIERRHGRRRGAPNAPRTLDLDLLLYGDAVIAQPHLAVPHPRMHERAFVLRPLAELDRALTVPGRGRVLDLLAACAAQDVERLAA